MTKNITFFIFIALFLQCNNLNIKTLGNSTSSYPKERQTFLKKAICDIENNKTDYIDFINNKTLNLTTKDWGNGKTLLHVAVKKNDIKAVDLLIRNQISRLKENNQSYVNKGTISDWVNIEDNDGKTPVDYLDRNNNFKSSPQLIANDYLSYKLNSLSAKKGSNITYEKKLRAENFLFLQLMNELRLCFDNNDLERGEMLIKYFKYFSPKILSTLVSGWLRKESSSLYFNAIPICLYSEIANYICIFNLKTELDNLLLDEFTIFGDKHSELYKMLLKVGARHSDLYIQNNLLDNQTKKHTYKNHLASINNFLFKDNKTPVLVNFIKEIMTLGDAETLRLILSHSRINLIGYTGEDLVHFAISNLRCSIMAEILVQNGAYCEYIFKKKKICPKDKYYQI